MKKDGSTVLTPENVSASLQYGVVRGDGMHSLLHLMHGVYGPQLMGNRSWPDSTKKELAGQYHQFMASLTETAYQAAGKTVLYLPPENISDVNEAAKDKEFVQQLESIVIYWTRQIKEVRGAASGGAGSVVVNCFCTEDDEGLLLIAGGLCACFISLLPGGRW